MRIRKLSYLGLLTALAVALNILETLIPSPLPWVRLGLANLLTLIAILTSGWREGFAVALLRVVVTSLLFGGFLGPSFILSLGGALASTALMSLMAPAVWRLYSPLGMSAAGAFAHGLAQVLVLRFILVRSWEILYLLPWVLLPAVISGLITGLLANFILLRRGEVLRALGGLNSAKAVAAEPERRTPPLVLASSSPRRRALLGHFGLPFSTVDPGVDESVLPGEDPTAHARRLAVEKAAAVAERIREGLVVAADTIVVLDGEIIGKPRDREEACRMLARLAGRRHHVYTGVAVADTATGRIRRAVIRSRVTMASLTRKQIERYVASGEPLDKAGAYAVQGMGGTLISTIEGSFTNVVGLPLLALKRLLERSGCTVVLPDIRL